MKLEVGNSTDRHANSTHRRSNSSVDSCLAIANLLKPAMKKNVHNRLKSSKKPNLLDLKPLAGFSTSYFHFSLSWDKSFWKIDCLHLFAFFCAWSIASDVKNSSHCPSKWKWVPELELAWQWVGTHQPAARLQFNNAAQLRDTHA